MSKGAMKRLCLLLVVLSLLACIPGCERQGAQVDEGEKKQSIQGTIIVMGDSLTVGYGVAQEESLPYLLEKKLIASGHYYRVVNAGVSGETSSGALSRLPWVLTMKPDILILETGANDGLRGLPPSHIKDNLLSILDKLQQKNITTILAGMRMVSNLGEEYTEEFKNVYSEVALETGVIFMPFFLEGVAANPELNREDGIHPNEKGYRVIADNVFPYVLQAVAKRNDDTPPGMR